MSKQNQKREVYLVAQNIRSLFNVGSLFRCADVFSVSKIYLCGYTGHPPLSEIAKVALGAERFIEWEHNWHTHLVIKRLKQQGVKIIALETGQSIKPLPRLKPKFPLALIVGNEVKGITKPILKLADEIVKIPMLGKKESLNVAVAAGIALYRLRN